MTHFFNNNQVLMENVSFQDLPQSSLVFLANLLKYFLKKGFLK